MKQDELMVIGSLDQPIQTSDDWLINQIDEVVKRSVEEHNAYIALNTGKLLYAVSKTVGKGLARLLYEMKKNWDQYNMSEEFDEIVFDYIGLHPDNVSRYINVSAMLAEGQVPEPYRKDIEQRNLRELIHVAAALKQGYEIGDEEWEKLIEAPDYNTVLKVLREDVKGKPPRKGSLQMYLDDAGSIWAWQDNEKYFVGSLDVDAREEPIQHAIERITKSAGILR